MRYLERQTTLTGNQRRIIAAAILGDMLEFFDYFLIGYVVAFIAGPWKLTFGKSAVILLSSGLGLMLGAVFYGWLADRDRTSKGFPSYHSGQLLAGHRCLGLHARQRVAISLCIPPHHWVWCRRSLLCRYSARAGIRAGFKTWHGRRPRDRIRSRWYPAGRRARGDSDTICWMETSLRY